MAALCAAACAAPAASPASAPATLAAQIDAAIGDAACDSSAQCRTLAYGHKACGGPERYVAYSLKRSDGERLAALGAALAAERRAQAARAGLVSTCSLVRDPGAACVAGRCVPLQEAGPLPAR